MKREIKEIDEKRGIVRITSTDERWYAKPSSNDINGLPEYKFYPSSTWIAGHYPKGIGFYKWLAEKGWDEAEALKIAAGERGSKVHQATQLLENGVEIRLDTLLFNPNTSEQEEISVEEWEAILSYADWFNVTKPQTLATELTVFNEKEQYAGTIDRILRIDGQIWIIDIKTSKSIWEEQIMQISSYSNADVDYKSLGITDEEWVTRKLAILQIGYRLNKNRYKFTEQPDKFDMFLTAKKIWANENPNSKPKQIELPFAISIKKAEQIKPKILKPIKTNK